ncbi:hypothetical protein BKA69DRAFT_1145020 [Paraphysoderma sedebokerense]|nr:hypothetical protein BKA69DRAFT_1145020 [Paraphysoderma sedebokerense]
MVFIHIKRSEESCFLYESSVAVPVDDLIPALVHIYNTRLRIERLCLACEDLCEYGVWKPVSDHGYSEEELDASFLAEKKEQEEKQKVKERIVKDGKEWLLNPDPTGRRCGEAPTEDLALIIRKTVSEARAVIAKENARSRVCLTSEKLKEAIDNIRGAVAIVYPIGLPEYEPVQEIIEDNEDLTGTAAIKEIYDPATATLWWAGKEIVRGKKLGDFIGKNEKTTVIAKLQKKGQGPPSREPPLDADGQKNMMSYWYKKQEENKKLIENEEDDYLNSVWANPKALKQQFNGLSSVSWGPRR